MENKRITHKLNSWFWWVLTSLPILILLFCIVFISPKFVSNYNDTYSNFVKDVCSYTSINNIFNIFSVLSISYCRNTFLNIFTDVFNINSPNVNIIATLFGWMLSVQVYHLIYDVLKFIFDWLHDFFERG